MLSIMSLRHIKQACSKFQILSVKKRKNILTSCNVSSNAMPELTSVRYNVERGPYDKISNSHIQFFISLLGQNRVITNPDDCDSYNVDWLKTVRGLSRLIIKPKTTEEVSAILQYCNENHLAVCPQSGNTGLVGGSVPVFDEIILSTKLMKNIIDTDELSGTLVCQAGCTLEMLENHLKPFGLMMPLDIGSKGSCLIGGCVSTNAGGIRLFRYGNLHGNLLGLEAVMANGKIINCLNTLKKDNTGYHIKNLFIGSEGTLGIVTKIAIQCPAIPKVINVIFLGMNSFDNVLKTCQLAKKELAEIMSSCEMMDKESMNVCTNNLRLTNPLPSNGGSHEFYVLIETAGSEERHDEEKLNSFLEKAFTQQIIADGILATEPTKIKNLWELRERIGEGGLYDGYVFKYDISLRLPNFYKIIEILRERLQNPRIIRIYGFGHLGDGNIHIQITTRNYDEEIASELEPFIFECTSDLHGSISAEHGIGFKKRDFLHFSKDDSAIQLMHQLKKTMDPNGILNPYKVL